MQAFAQMRTLLSFLPNNNTEQPPSLESDDPVTREDIELDELVPDNPNKPYDMKEIIKKVTDNGQFFEIQPDYAQNMVIGFARIGGKSVGLVANQPMVLAGCLDIDASVKCRKRFVRFCDAFNIPLLTLVDVPGFLPGTQQEWGGIIKHGAKLLYAFAEATVPKITVITRKAYGGAYDVMASKHIRHRYQSCLPHCRDCRDARWRGRSYHSSKGTGGEADDPIEKETRGIVEDYRIQFANPFRAAELGFIDGIIHPRQTRASVYRALKMLENKIEELPWPKKHGNIPLLGSSFYRRFAQS